MKLGMSTLICTILKTLLFILIMLKSLSGFGQISITSMNCRNCDCKTLTVTNASNDTVYFFTTSVDLVQDSCVFADAIFEKDATTNIITVDISRSANFSDEKPHWAYLFPKWSVDYNIKNNENSIDNRFIKLYVKAVKVDESQIKYGKKNVRLVKKKASKLNANYLILPL